MDHAPDWGDGAYERIAPALTRAAEHLVQIANPQPGERAVDLGCGSGNATLPLAAAGAQVTAIDPSLRLLGLATQRARDEGVRITTSVASAEQVPLPDSDADLVISNFGVIFSADPAAAITETLRVLTPTGRFVFTAWTPDGAIAEVGQLLRREADSSAPQHEEPDPADPAAAVLWHEPATFAHLVPGGADAMTVHHGEAQFTGESAGAWLEEQETHHPLWRAVRAAIADEDRWRAVMKESADVLTAGSEATDRLLITSPYAVIEIRPQH